VTYFALVDDLSRRDRPVGVLRRGYRDGSRRDEAFYRGLTRHRSSPARSPASSRLDHGGISSAS